jgi:hypothetical protein
VEEVIDNSDRILEPIAGEVDLDTPETEEGQE